MNAPVVAEFRASNPVVRAEQVVKRFPLRSPILRRTVGHVEALRGVDLTIHAGESVALVGESGSGKTTLGRCIIGLDETDEGTIRYFSPNGAAWTPASQKQLARQVQCVFQDPATSLTPRMSIGQIVGEPLVVHSNALEGESGQKRVSESLEAVGIPAAWAKRYPHELSGGQRQRVAIARAIVLHPQLIVLDEPVSALDVAVQAQILQLLGSLQESFDLAYLLISHDLGVVRALADYVYVMYLGKIVEHGRPEQVLRYPLHPYTAALLESDPSHELWDVDDAAEVSRLNAFVSPNPACAYAPRCRFAQDLCVSQAPELTDSSGNGYAAACHYALRAIQTTVEKEG